MELIQNLKLIQGNDSREWNQCDRLDDDQRKKLIERTSTRSYDDSFMTCKKVVGEREASMMQPF